MNTAIILFSVIALAASVASIVGAYIYRQNTRQELQDLRQKVMQLESDYTHLENKHKILSEEHHDLLKRFVNK